MANELTTITQADLDELIKVSGQQNEQGKNYIPRVRINRDGEDDAGKQIPVGTFAVTQDGKSVYSKTAILRVLKNAYQYSVFNEEEKRYTNQTIIFSSFNDEAIDEQGTVACGKIAKRKLEGVTEDVLKEQKRIKCARLVYGLLTMDGVDADGNKVPLVELPVLFKMTGSNFMPIGQEALDVIQKKKLLWSQVPIVLGTKRQKVGSNVFYNLIIEPDFANIKQITREDIEHTKMFNEMVTEFNQGIIKKYQEAKRLEGKTISSKEVVDQLEADFYSDDIDDVGA
jgi:hypothetical protein